MNYLQCAEEIEDRVLAALDDGAPLTKEQIAEIIQDFDTRHASKGGEERLPVKQITRCCHVEAEEECYGHIGCELICPKCGKIATLNTYNAPPNPPLTSPEIPQSESKGDNLDRMPDKSNPSAQFADCDSHPIHLTSADEVVEKQLAVIARKAASNFEQVNGAPIPWSVLTPCIEQACLEYSAALQRELEEAKRIIQMVEDCYIEPDKYSEGQIESQIEKFHKTYGK